MTAIRYKVNGVNVRTMNAKWVHQTAAKPLGCSSKYSRWLPGGFVVTKDVPRTTSRAHSNKFSSHAPNFNSCPIKKT